jgi:hypothetical protein
MQDGNVCGVRRCACGTAEAIPPDLDMVYPVRFVSPAPNVPLAIGREERFEEMLTYTQEKNIHVRLKSATQQPTV